MITNEHLVDIEHAFNAGVLNEIFEQFARCGRRPSVAVCEALGRVYGKTSAEVAEEFDLFAAVKS